MFWLKKEKDAKKEVPDLFPSLRVAVEKHELDASSLTLALSMPVDSETNPFIEDRRLIYLSDRRHWFGKWSISSLRDLFRGTQEPPTDMERYPEAYVGDFSLIECSVLMAHDFIHETTDDEFAGIYSLIKRRPEGRSEGFLHDIAYQAGALVLGLKPRSQREFEAIFSRLARSARFWREGYASRNYIAYLKKSFSDVLAKKNSGREQRTVPGTEGTGRPDS
jgi:hypothetical protein